MNLTRIENLYYTIWDFKKRCEKVKRCTKLPFVGVRENLGRKN